MASNQDLIVVVPDLDAEVTLRTLLQRKKSLGIRSVAFQVDRFVKRDSGCYGEVHNYLRPFVGQFDRAVVVFDRHGCGREDLSRSELETNVEARLARNGWSGRSAAVVLDPELEIWVWSRSPQVPIVLGWRAGVDGLWEWLSHNGFIAPRGPKPTDPKAAFHAVLRLSRKRASANLFAQLAERVSLRGCQDDAFLKLTFTLQQWFPADPSQ